MSDRALSEATMLASLRDIHLPASAPGGVWAELCVAVGLAALAALVVAAVLRAFTVRRTGQGPVSLQDRVAALEALPDDARRVALLHVLRAYAPQRYADLRAALYKPGPGVTLATLEAEVARLV
ncbi:hypothetical protein Dshi_0458 [Dinoroseobacter shibae DFL 12 = DSM 16493]|jgi:hypothetical protein|uniref:Transmembrane protein n=1 Tax=Dinoroseobacter shibae (strain DSM 16493 / NCIMB 14021 / DFL 12) TaxID=398580 RepID=A8LNP8_DINSH|nr:hypothetical protein [Dinoroseobacter shibae]ABV92206.1 hypothetical protein Dshi_0458 [Dinoroseobacter shibae DFL 12 = DSM 16493]URF47159.1 hypothetical protein M8008_02345 [Dinoroseobacter shibae]URF51470.1 hypothetical protein M8007_02345 [Dinoroseobacter shibae]